MNLARAQTKLGNTVWHRNWLYKRFYDEQRFQAVEQRRNVLVADGTSTGKTTLVSALLAEVAKTSDRVILIEDTRELHCRAESRCLAYHSATSQKWSACHIQTATFQSLIGVSVL
jgi:hypothetical protein